MLKKDKREIQLEDARKQKQRKQVGKGWKL